MTREGSDFRKLKLSSVFNDYRMFCRELCKVLKQIYFFLHLSIDCIISLSEPILNSTLTVIFSSKQNRKAVVMSMCIVNAKWNIRFKVHSPPHDSV